METFATNDNKHILYYDFPFYKKVSKNGAIKKPLENSDALSQAIKIWLVSKQNEKIRSRGGGILYNHLGKMMDNERANMIKSQIVNGLKNEFNPPSVSVQVDVYPNVEQERWEIYVVAYNADLQIGVNNKIVVTNSL